MADPDQAPDLGTRMHLVVSARARGKLSAREAHDQLVQLILEAVKDEPIDPLVAKAKAIANAGRLFPCV